MELFKLLGIISISNDEANRSIDDTTSRAEQSESRMSKAFKKVGTAVAAGFAADKIVSFGKAAIDTTASFEDGMLKVQSLSGATQEEYEKLSKAALDYGSSTAWSAKDVSDAMGYMALAGFDTNQILESTSGMLSLASASGEDLATVTDILTDSMTGFGDSADQASRYADVLATVQAKSNTTVGDLGEAFKYVSSLAGTYHYNLEDVSAALGTMANAGVKGSMAGTALSSIITRLGTNTSGARDAIEALGVSFYNQDGTARNLGDVLKDLCDATEGMDVAQKAEFASTVAGTEAQKGLLAILNQGSGAYEDLQDKLYDCSGAASDMASNMESGLGGSIRSLQSAWEGFQIKFGEAIEPGVSAAISKLAEFVQKVAIPALDTLSDGMSNILNWMKEHEKAVEAVGGALEVAAAAMVAFKAGAAIQGVVRAFQEAQLAIALFSASTEGATVAQGLLNGALTLGEGIVGLLTGKMTLAELAQVGMTKAQAALNAVMSANPIGIVIAVIAALVAAFVVLWKKSDAFRNFWISIWEGIKEFAALAAEGVKAAIEKLKQVFDAAATKIQEIWDTVSTAMKDAWDTIVSVVEVAVQLIVQIITLAFDMITLPFRFIWENCKDIIISAWNAISDWLSKKFDAIADCINTVWTAISDFFGTIWDAVYDKVSSKVEAIRSVVDNVFNKIKSAATTIWNAVSSVVKAAWDAISSTVSSALSAVSSKVSGVWNSIKSTIGGVVNNIKSVVSNGFDAMKSKIDGILDGIKSKFSSVFNGIKSYMSGIVNWLKGIFKFKWNLPKIKLPHFNVKGKFSLNPPSTPSFGIEWYKNGGVMNEPTAFGINPSNGKTMVGGEAGAEAIAPIDTLKQYIREAVGSVQQKVEHTGTIRIEGVNSKEELIGVAEAVLDDYIRTLSREVRMA